MSGLILHLSVSQSLVFLLNSRLGHFSAPHLREDPLSRSYRVNLPNSLAMTHSSTFGYSPRPPVSVCGTGGAYLKLSGFSRESVPRLCRLSRSLGVLSPLCGRAVLHSRDFASRLQPAIPSAGGRFATPSPHRNMRRHGIVEPSPIGCPAAAAGSP